MTVDLFLGGLAILILAATIIVAMTSDSGKTRSFGLQDNKRNDRTDRAGR